MGVAFDSLRVRLEPGPGGLAEQATAQRLPATLETPLHSIPASPVALLLPTCPQGVSAGVERTALPRGVGASSHHTHPTSLALCAFFVLFVSFVVAKTCAGFGGAGRIGVGWGCRKVLVLRRFWVGAKKVEKSACVFLRFVRLYVPFSRHGVSHTASNGPETLIFGN